MKVRPVAALLSLFMVYAFSDAIPIASPTEKASHMSHQQDALLLGFQRYTVRCVNLRVVKQSDRLQGEMTAGRLTHKYSEKEVSHLGV